MCAILAARSCTAQAVFEKRFAMAAMGQQVAGGHCGGTSRSPFRAPLSTCSLPQNRQSLRTAFSGTKPYATRYQAICHALQQACYVPLAHSQHLMLPALGPGRGMFTRLHAC